jgi:hypothetical protein
MDEGNLRKAAESGNITTVRDLLGRGTNVNAADIVSNILMCYN